MILTYLSISLSAGIWLYLIYRYDRFEPEPVKLVLIIGALGGITSSIPAALLNNAAASLLGVREFIYKTSEALIDYNRVIIRSKENIKKYNLDEETLLIPATLLGLLTFSTRFAISLYFSL